jgi:hypothetical protein
MCCIQRFARALSELHAERKQVYNVEGICYNGDIGEDGEE